MGLKPSAMPTTGSGWCRPTFALPSLATWERCRLKALGGPIRHVVLHQPRSHGPGTGRLSPPGASRLATRAYETREVLDGPRSCETRDPRRELRPNPIRSDTSCRAITAHQVESLVRAAAAPDELERYASDDPAAQTLLSRVNEESVGLTWPRRAPACAGCKKPGTEGRFTRTPAKRYEIGCTRGAFHRRAIRTRDTGLSPCIACRVGSSPQVVTNLWTTRGAVPSLAGPCSDPAALTGGRRRGLGLRCGWTTENRPEPAR
jgi:hypothetical protein